MTVGENVALPLREHTQAGRFDHRNHPAVELDQVGLSKFENYMPSQLSGA